MAIKIVDITTVDDLDEVFKDICTQVTRTKTNYASRLVRYGGIRYTVAYHERKKGKAEFVLVNPSADGFGVNMPANNQKDISAAVGKFYRTMRQNSKNIDELDRIVDTNSRYSDFDGDVGTYFPTEPAE